MGYPERLIHIVAGVLKPGHCKYCGRSIQWATSSHGKNLPLNPDPWILRYERNAGGVKLAVIGADALHFTTCTKRPERPKRMRMFGGRARG